MKTRVLMILSVIFLCVMILLSLDYMKPVYQSAASLLLIPSCIFCIYYLIAFLTMPYVGIVAICEMSADARGDSFCTTAYQWSYVCLRINLVFPPLFFFLFIFFAGGLLAHEISVLLLFCSIITCLIANLLQIIINILLFYKYHNALQLFALITQMLMCVTMYFVNLLFSQIAGGFG
jgi:hypothetical protein